MDISLPRPSADLMVKQVNKFHYNPETGRSFAKWFERCEDIFRNGITDIPSGVKFGTLGTTEKSLKFSSILGIFRILLPIQLS